MIALDSTVGHVGERDELFDVAYQEIRRVAGYYMARERSAHTLQPTALVHEAYLKVKRGDNFAFNDRTHFVVLAARAMRQVLIESARKRNADKRSGERVDITLSSLSQATAMTLVDFIAVHDALHRLAQKKPNGERHAQLIELVWLGGLDFTEAAGVLGISRRQAHRDWAFARVWLERELGHA